MRDIVQIAGVADEAEARMLVECGVDYLGFPLRLDVHHEDISEDAAAKIIRRLRPPASGVLITYLTAARDIAELCRFLGCSIVQLHGAVSVDEIVDLKRVAPALRVTKALIVRGDDLDEQLRAVRTFEPHVDALITDTFDARTGASGATGKTHDWTISRRIAEVSRRPVMLAGGLHHGNVRRAIRAVRPAGVDAHTGVEDKTGRKSRERVKAFVSEAKAAFASL